MPAMPSTTRHITRPLKLAIARALLLLPLALAGPAGLAGTITLSGPYFSDPPIDAVGPGDILLPGSSLWLGAGDLAVLTASDGALIRLLRLGIGGSGGSGDVYLRGSTLDLTGDGGWLRVGDGGPGYLRASQNARIAMGGADSHIVLGHPGGAGTLELLGGSQLSGAERVVLGDGGGKGTLIISGAGTSFTTGRQGAQRSDIFVAPGNTGVLRVSDGARLSAQSVEFFSGANATATIEGSGTVATFDVVDWHRMSLNTGTFTVNSGALLDGASLAEECMGRWCGAFIANNAGDTAEFIVTGAGSDARFLSQLVIGGAFATRPPATDYTIGMPGADSSATVRVLDGGRLRTETVQAGLGPSGSAALGTERVTSLVEVAGRSRWEITGNPLDGQDAALLTNIGNGVNTSVALEIKGGSTLVLGGAGVPRARLVLGDHGGSASMAVSSGALVDFASTEGDFEVGSGGGIGLLVATGGATLDGLTYLHAGRGAGSRGTVLLEGEGTSLLMKGNPRLRVGADNGTGALTFRDGALLDARSGTFQSLLVGTALDGTSASGTLIIDGPGTRVLLGSSTWHGVPEGTATSAWMPVGSNGTGNVVVGNGGLLALGASAGATPEQYSFAAIAVGLAGSSDASLTVTGAGSRATIAGNNAQLFIGEGTLSRGQVAVLEGGRLDSTRIFAGSYGGTANLLADRGTIALAGQFTDQPVGAGITAGLGAHASGTVTLRNGALLTVANGGSAGADITVGQEGTGRLLVDASTVDIAGGSIVIGRDGGVGSMEISGHSSVTAGRVTVGHDTGEQGRLTVNDSRLTARLLEIGVNGAVGGNGVIEADVVTRGLFRPGNSPGVLTIDGAVTALDGARLELEIASDGQGSFVTDRMIFSAGHKRDIGSLQVTFHFLGEADPTAFEGSGLFDIDQFFAEQGDAGLAALTHDAFDGIRYTATADQYVFTAFTFSADGGAQFAVTPVPEPAEWAMLLAGLTVVAGLRRARRR